MRHAPLLLLVLAGCPADEESEPAPEPWACGDPWQSDEPSHPLPPDWVPKDGEFLMVVLPDTQVYAWQFPATFDAQLRWVATWAEPYHIAFVSHVGDIVQHASAADQWEVARAAFSWLDEADVPHGFSAGAHDYAHAGAGWDREVDTSCAPNFGDVDCAMSDYLAAFGPQHYTDRAWYAGASPSGHSNYELVQAGGIDLLFLHLPQDPRRAEVEWAKQVLDANPGTLVHLTTHRYLYDYRLTEALPPPLGLIKAGRFNALTYAAGDQHLIFPDSLSAEQLYDELVYAYPNVWGVHCGHVDAEFKQRSVNSAGLPVYEVLVDYQDMADGGGGWMRVLKFRPADRKVDVITLSATTGEIRANGAGFDHAISILEAYRGAALGLLEDLGVDVEQLNGLLEAVKTEGTEERALFRASLYGTGERDSCFTLDVDFGAYVEASR
jgi:hypothetical protein